MYLPFKNKLRAETQRRLFLYDSTQWATAEVHFLQPTGLLKPSLAKCYLVEAKPKCLTFGVFISFDPTAVANLHSVWLQFPNYPLVGDMTDSRSQYIPDYVCFDLFPWCADRDRVVDFYNWSFDLWLDVDIDGAIRGEEVNGRTTILHLTPEERRMVEETSPAVSPCCGHDQCCREDELLGKEAVDKAMADDYEEEF